MVAAAQATNQDPDDPDPELGVEVSEIEKASWGSHSFRRGADKRARDYCMEKGLSLDLVDKVFGWKEAEHKRDMQLHYDEDSLSRRFAEAQVTWAV